MGAGACPSAGTSSCPSAGTSSLQARTNRSGEDFRAVQFSRKSKALPAMAMACLPCEAGDAPCMTPLDPSGNPGTRRHELVASASTSMPQARGVP